MNILRYLASAIITMTSLAAMAMTPQAAVDSFAEHPHLRHASVGICLMNFDSAKVIASHCPDQSQITASTMKTLTSATAIELLGKDFTFSTRVYVVGEIDRHGTLKGNLVVHGDGDPTLGSRYFAEHPHFVDSIVAVVKSIGIKKIKGAITVDGSAIPFPPVAPEWMVEDLPCDYGAGCFGACFADNIITVSFDRSGDCPTDFTTSPLMPALHLKNQAMLYNAGEKVPYNGISAIMDYDTPAITLTGATRRSEKRFTGTFANPAPHMLLQDSILRALRFADIKVKDSHYRDGDLNDSTLLLDFHSPVLTDIVRSLLHRSDNMFTEMVLRAIAAQSGQFATARNGVTIVRDYWRNRGIDISPLFMHDGSGLARNGKNSARFFCEMLGRVYADRDSIGVDFATLLPLAGAHGTVRSLLDGTKLQGSVALKSGSMGDVLCYVGYFPAQQPKYSVAILVNNYNCSYRELQSHIEEFFLNLFSEIDW